jgi:DNA-binding GntR family transcriptional regulator
MQTMIDKSSPIPAYYQLTLLLRTKILSGEWNEGTKIPKEDELASLYKVSRVTVRQALKSLEKEGMISRIKRSGTIVRKIPGSIIHDFSLPSILCAKLGQRGVSLNAEILEMAVIPRIQAINTALKLKSDQRLAHIKRLFLYDTMAIAINESWISEELVPDMAEKGLINNHLSTTLTQRYNLSPERIQNTIQAVNLSAGEIETLQVSYETPVMQVTSISFLPYDVPLEYSQTSWRSDLVKFSFEIK